MNHHSQHHQAVLDLPFGPVALGLRQGRLVEVNYLEGSVPSYRREARGLDRVIQAIERYLVDARSPLDVELELTGTPFQQRVWQALQAIPAGETVSYGELARELGSGARAVGNACRANPCPLVVPCHRVVAARGLGGFAGERTGTKLAIKRWLLHHEGGA